MGHHNTSRSLSTPCAKPPAPIINKTPVLLAAYESGTPDTGHHLDVGDD